MDYNIVQNKMRVETVTPEHKQYPLDRVEATNLYTEMNMLQNIINDPRVCMVTIHELPNIMALVAIQEPLNHDGTELEHGLLNVRFLTVGKGNRYFTQHWQTMARHFQMEKVVLDNQLTFTSAIMETIIEHFNKLEEEGVRS